MSSVYNKYKLNIVLIDYQKKVCKERGDKERGGGGNRGKEN